MPVIDLDNTSVAAVLRQLQELPLRDLRATLGSIRNKFAVDLGPLLRGGGPELGGERDEWTQLVREGRCWVKQFALAAVAAQFGTGVLRNPSNSGMRLLVRAVFADQDYVIGLSQNFNPGGSNSNVVPWNLQEVPALGAGPIGTSDVVALNTATAIVTEANGLGIRVPAKQIFQLGTGCFVDLDSGALSGFLTIQSLVANVVFNGWFMWAEVEDRLPAAQQTHRGGYP